MAQDGLFREAQEDSAVTTTATTPARPSLTAGHHRQVPVIALTGYLGAGKTTVLNHLLEREGTRAGVVVNDFGDVNVDAGLVSGQVDEPMSISGGCLCCLPAAGGLDTVLGRLAHPGLALDVIFVEASGVADPAALAHLIRVSPVTGIRPAGVIEVVDAPAYFETLDTRVLPPARFAPATLILLNKVDRLPDGAQDPLLDRIHERIRTVNHGAALLPTARGEFDPALVFDVALAEDPPDQLPLARLSREARTERSTPAHHHVHALSTTAATGSAVDPVALVALLRDPPAGAYRLKGRVEVWTPRGRRPFVINAVGRDVQVTPLGRGKVLEGSELVAIGMHLDTDATHDLLSRALLPPAPDADPTEAERALRTLEALSLRSI